MKRNTVTALIAALVVSSGVGAGAIAFNTGKNNAERDAAIERSMEEDILYSDTADAVTEQLQKLDRINKNQTTAERLAAEKKIAETKASIEKSLASENEKNEKAAAEKALAEKKAAEEKAANEKAAAEKKAAEENTEPVIMAN